MAAMTINMTRAAANTFLTSDLSVAAAEAAVVIDALYGTGGGTPTSRFWDSRALRTLCESQIGASNTQLLFAALGVEY
jgi:NAD(P)H-hydrate repair Nnr-like enzyme with NAD(P)H-hydrate epimerase domain